MSVGWRGRSAVGRDARSSACDDESNFVPWLAHRIIEERVQQHMHAAAAPPPFCTRLAAAGQRTPPSFADMCTNALDPAASRCAGATRSRPAPDAPAATGGETVAAQAHNDWLVEQRTRTKKVNGKGAVRPEATAEPPRVHQGGVGSAFVVLSLPPGHPPPGTCFGRKRAANSASLSPGVIMSVRCPVNRRWGRKTERLVPTTDESARARGREQRAWRRGCVRGLERRSRTAVGDDDSPPAAHVAPAIPCVRGSDHAGPLASEP